MTFHPFPEAVKSTVNITSTAFASQEHQFANAAWWRATLASEAVLTRDELPDLRR